MFKEGIFKQKKQIYEDPILLNQDEYTTQEERYFYYYCSKKHLKSKVIQKTIALFTATITQLPKELERERIQNILNRELIY